MTQVTHDDAFPYRALYMHAPARRNVPSNSKVRHCASLRHPARGLPMTREDLPRRRAADVVTFEHEGRRWTATAGRFADGRLAELFLDAPKVSPLADAARESAILVSLALQHGCAVETIRHALDGRGVSPVGAALAAISRGGAGDGAAGEENPSAARAGDLGAVEQNRGGKHAER